MPPWCFLSLLQQSEVILLLYSNLPPLSTKILSSDIPFIVLSLRDRTMRGGGECVSGRCPSLCPKQILKKTCSATPQTPVTCSVYGHHRKVGSRLSEVVGEKSNNFSHGYREKRPKDASLGKIMNALGKPRFSGDVYHLS